VPEYAALWRHYAVDCAERVAHLLADKRGLDALRVARRHADGMATDKELSAAWNAAAGAAWSAAADAAAREARAAARDAAWAAAWDAERKWQSERLRQYLTSGQRPQE
jgi:hypothetical protein